MYQQKYYRLFVEGMHKLGLFTVASICWFCSGVSPKFYGSLHWNCAKKIFTIIEIYARYLRIIFGQKYEFYVQ